METAKTVVHKFHVYLTFQRAIVMERRTFSLGVARRFEPCGHGTGLLFSNQVIMAHRKEKILKCHGL